MESRAELLKLPAIPERVKFLIRAAKILPASHRDAATEFLDLALAELKNWGSQENTSWSQRNAAATLRTEVLAAYSLIDAEKVIALQQELQTSEANTGTGGSTSAARNQNWFTLYRNQRATADRAAKLALSLTDTDAGKASALVISSLQGGIVSGVLFEIVTKLQKPESRSFLNQLELAMGQTLVSNITADPISLTNASILIRSDSEMPAAARNAFVSFLIRSLEAWINLVREPGGAPWVDADYVSTAYTSFAISSRPAILQYAPNQLLRFDGLLDQVRPLVPASTVTKLQAFQPEPLTDPHDRLNDILKDTATDRRDLRLLRLVSELLGRESEDFQKTWQLAAEAISKFSDADMKAAFTDQLTIARANLLVKQNKFIEADRVTESISSPELRAWALLAISSVEWNKDKVLGFERISHSLRVLDSATASARKVELALSAAAMLAKDSPERAFETLAVASRYAKSAMSPPELPTKPPVAFGLEVKLGQAHTRLGVVPMTLADVKIDPSLSLLATADWFRANEIVQEIRNPSLRLQLRFQFAETVLARTPKAGPSSVKPVTNY